MHHLAGVLVSESLAWELVAVVAASLVIGWFAERGKEPQ